MTPKINTYSQISSSALSLLDGQVVGFFRKLAVGNLPGDGVSFYEESNSSGNLKIQGNLTAKGIIYSSDRNRKENMEPINPRVMLEKLVTVPVSEWSFKRDDTRHFGPMTQDFYAAFGVGEDDKII